MKHLSRIEMAFELLKAEVTGGLYYTFGTTEQEKNDNLVKRAFTITDAFIKYVNNKNNKQ